MFPAKKETTKVAAVKCGSYDPDLLLEKVKAAIDAVGGLHALIKPGAKILIKPNLLSAKPPEQAVTTHPEVVRAIVRVLKERNVKDIYIGDSPASTTTPWSELWEKTGYLAMAEEEWVNLFPFEDAKVVEVEGIGKVPIPRDLEMFDAMISVPKLKTHLLTKMTGAVKNSFGIVVGGAKSNFHGENASPLKMADFLARLYGFLAPDFVLMDAVVGMEGNGPSDGSPKEFGVLFAGIDAAAVDACACRMYGYRPLDIPLISRVSHMELGLINDDQIEKVGDAWDVVENTRAKRSSSEFIHQIPESFFKIVTVIASCYPEIRSDKCVSCGACAEICSQKAITKVGKRYRVNRKHCILCMCCIEACPYHAIDFMSPVLRLQRLWRKIKRLFKPGKDK